MTLLVDALGWLGAAALLGAYALTSAGRLRSTGVPFQVLNAAGAVALAVNTAYHGAWPSTALNAVWLVIGAVALTRLATTRRPGRLPSGVPAGVPADGTVTAGDRRPDR